MLDPGELEELIAYPARSSRQSSQEARRVVGEVPSFLRETPEDFVRRRPRTRPAMLGSGQGPRGSAGAGFVLLEDERCVPDPPAQRGGVHRKAP